MMSCSFLLHSELDLYNDIIDECEYLLDQTGKQHRYKHNDCGAQQRTDRNDDVFAERIIVNGHHSEEDEESGPHISQREEH